jgi:class 3 adenylate cyclase
MKHLIPLKVKKENLQFFKTTRIAYVFGLLAHGSAIPFFWTMGVMELVYFNAFISVPFFSFAIIKNRLGYHNLAFTIAFFELYFHQVLGTYFLGWSFGAQFWLFYLCALCFFNPNWKRLVQLSLLGLISTSYVGLFYLFPEGQYAFDPGLGQNMYLTNAVSIIILISLLINYYSKSIYKEEQKLIEEKKITEEQNKQLLEQHDTLVKEREKTHKVLNKVRSLFGQQVSKEVADEMIESETEIDSKIMDVTVMFLDIRDFTRFADSREPAEVAGFQNTVFGELIDIVREYQGIVSQILGDGIMAVFGAPVATRDHLNNAVKAGYAMINRIKELGDSGKIPHIKVGIGLNSGKVMAGNVGNEIRKFYSLAGTNVIIAARIEQLNKQFDSQFLVSGSVYEGMELSEYHVNSLGEIELKGIEKKIPVYRLV